MNWTDIACIVFTCVTANHLGLISAIETVTKIHGLPIVSCVKCLTFWVVLSYGLFNGGHIITMLAISFLASYLALWLELIEAFIDKLYMKLYGTIDTDNTDDTDTADADYGDSASTVSELQEDK